ncbi:MAG: hypothetical protein FWG12_07045 [Holophagaceae bacterium]|nr:hypothetical protein [Holophagaceae bacterium]
MTNLTITISDDVAKIAQAQGLLTTVALEAYILEKAVKGADVVADYPHGFDPRLKGAVNPAAYRRGQILGDILSPINQEWEAMQ